MKLGFKAILNALVGPRTADQLPKAGITEEVTRRIVANASRGNVNLVLGRFLTAEDVMARKESVIRHDAKFRGC